MAIKLRGRPLPRWGYHSGECRGEAGGESGHGSNHAGERLACCILFFLRNPVACSPFFLAIGSPFRTETLSGIRLGYGAGRSPPVLALRQQAGRALFYRIIF